MSWLYVVAPLIVLAVVAATLWFAVFANDLALGGRLQRVVGDLEERAGSSHVHWLSVRSGPGGWAGAEFTDPAGTPTALLSWSRGRITSEPVTAGTSPTCDISELPWDRAAARLPLARSGTEIRITALEGGRCAITLIRDGRTIELDERFG